MLQKRACAAVGSFVHVGFAVGVVVWVLSVTSLLRTRYCVYHPQAKKRVEKMFEPATS